MKQINQIVNQKYFWVPVAFHTLDVTNSNRNFLFNSGA